MDDLLNFLADNYKWFMIAAGVLLFALFGFLMDGRKKKKEAASAQMPQNGQVNTVQNMNAQAQMTEQPAPQTQVAPTAAVPPVEQTPSLDVLNGTPVTPANQSGDQLAFGPVEAPAPQVPNEEEKLVIEMPNGSLADSVLEEAPVPDTNQTVQAPETPLTIEQAVGVESTAPSIGAQVPIQEAGPAPEMVAAPAMETPVAPAEPMPVSMTPEAPAPVAPIPEPAAPAPEPVQQPAQQVYQNTIQQ